MSSGAAAPPSSRRSFLWLYVAPVLLLLAVLTFPLAVGTRTLYLRDVFGTHLEMKAAQSEMMRHGLLPLINPYRAGGQPAVGNPDSVPLYPDNLLYLIAPTLWALNAHFWIHLLLAPLAMYWLGRAWGLRREAAWAAGTVYALGGYFLSHMMLYNQIAGAALAPALVAACLRSTDEESGRGSAAGVAVLWALLLLGGEPFMALLALCIALAAVVARCGLRPRILGRLWLPLACGTLIAAPQIIEFLRIVGLSYRGHLGYSSGSRLAASWDPRQMAEWVLPFFFGRPDRLDARAFWGFRFFTGHPPYYFSLYPGLLALALAAAGLACGRRRVLWPLAAMAAGLFLALGQFNPAAAWLIESGGGLVRYPVRMWLPVAIGGSLLAGIGFERCILEREPRVLRVWYLTLGALASLFLLGWASLSFSTGSVESWLAGSLPPHVDPGSAGAALKHWNGLCLVSLAVLALLAITSGLAGRLPREAGAFLLTLHTAAQVLLLAPLLATDAAGPYGSPSSLLQAIPAGSTVAHGGSEGLFGTGSPAARLYPGAEGFWFSRRAFFEAYPFAGELWGRRYELNVSSEGLDSFLTTAARDAVRLADDASRIRLLAASGVEYLILDRPLEPAALGQVEPLLSLPSFGGSIDLYRIPAAAPPVMVAARVLRAPSLNAAVRDLEDKDFDPRSMVVLPGDPSQGSSPQPGSETAPGAVPSVRVVESGPESLSVEVEAPASGTLVIQRAFLPLYRATVDGAPTPLRIANLHRIGIDIPAGSHRVELQTDRRALRSSLLLSALGMAGVGMLVRRIHPRTDAIRNVTP